MSAIIVTCSACGAKNRIPEKKQHLHPRCGKCAGPVNIGAAAVPVSLGDGDFQQFIRAAELPVMVDFFSAGCGPCQALAPIITKLAGRYLGKIIVAKLDTGAHPGTASHYRIRGVPTLMFFRAGELLDQVVGAVPEAELIARLDRISQ